MKRKELFILISIFIIALCIRGALLYYSHDDDYFSGIKSGIDTLARNLAQGNGFVVDTDKGFVPFFHSLPGYSFLLAITYKIFGGPNDIFLQIIQIICSSLSVFLIFGIAKKFFSNNIALLSSFLWALWLPEACISVAVLHDAPTVLLTLLAGYLFICAVLDKKQIFFVYSAVIIGFTSYIRSDPILLPVFFGLALWIYKNDWKVALKKTFLMLSIVFIILLPWGIRNYSVFNRFVFTRTVLWQSMWEGFGEFKNPFGAVLSDEITHNQVLETHPNITYGSPEYQDILKEKVIKALKSDPVWYFSMLPKRFFFMIFSPRGSGFLSNILDKNFGRQEFLETHQGLGNIDYAKWLLKVSPQEFFMRIGLIIFLQFLFVFATLLGIWFSRKQWRKNLLSLSPLLYFYLSHLPIYWEARYLVPGEFPMLIFSAVSIATLYNIIKNKLKPKLVSIT